MVVIVCKIIHYSVSLFEIMYYLCIVVTSTLNFSPLIFRSVPNLVGAVSEETIPGLGKRLPHFGTSVWGKI